MFVFTLGRAYSPWRCATQPDTLTSDFVALRDALDDLLKTWDLSATTSLGADVRRLLQAPGKLFSSADSSRRGFWALLPFALARYCMPNAGNTLTIRIALCCELLHSALDAFDEIEDDDSSEERDELGDGRLLNAATYLYTLVPSLLGDLSPSFLSLEQWAELQRLLTTELLSAMRGQHQDIVTEGADLASFSPEVCLQIAAAKSGGLFRLVCRLSAQAVNAPDALVQGFADVGEVMGVVAQLENDVHGLEVELQENASATSRKSDLRREKKTLPLVFAHRQLLALQGTPLHADREEQRGQDAATRQVLAYRNAILATLGAATQLREQARNRVDGIEQLNGPMPEVLRTLFGIDTVY